MAERRFLPRHAALIPLLWLGACTTLTPTEVATPGAPALTARDDSTAAAREAAAAHEDHALNRTRTPQKSDRTDLW